MSSESLSSTSTSSTIKPSGMPSKPIPLRALITKPVIISISNYITLASLDIAYAALLPLFYYTSPEQGGLGLSPSAIGIAMAAYGICNGVFQGLLFSSILDRFGAKRLFTFSISTFAPLFAFFPLINQVARHLGVGWLVWCLLALHIVIATICDMAFGPSSAQYN
jgi:MFS family permease